MSRENSSRPLYSIYNIGLNTFCVVRDADLLLWLYRWAVEFDGLVEMAARHHHQYNNNNILFLMSSLAVDHPRLCPLELG
jgi:hypothetical protein